MSRVILVFSVIVMVAGLEKGDSPNMVGDNRRDFGSVGDRETMIAPFTTCRRTLGNRSSNRSLTASGLIGSRLPKSAARVRKLSEFALRGLP